MKFDVEDYIGLVRESLQDYPELNHILLEREDGEEHSDKEIKNYLKRALARINAKPPKTRYTLKTFPDPQVHWLLIVDGAIVEALRLKGILKIRNEMPYQDQGGTSIRLEGKGQQYMQIVEQLYRGWYEMLLDFKHAISVRQAWGGVHSEYQKDWW
ncbi:MAG: hypothetical protein ACOC4M_11425 [Promethearchaeia archaeon]